MTDSLRDRIAAVLTADLRRQQGIDRPDRFLDWIDTSVLADAVIRELGLRHERLGGDIGHPHPQYRFVTEWISEVKDDG